MNNLKTFFLLTLLTLIAIGVGDYFGGQNGMILGFIIAGVTNFISYFFSDKIALAMYRAQPVTREQLPRIYAVVERLTQKAGLPMPKLFVIPTDSPNAFATGRNPNHASVAVTQGILNLLDDEELEGVLAHELGHVRNRDILTSSIAATLAGAIMVLARSAMWFGLGGDRDRDRGGGILMLLLAPLAAISFNCGFHVRESMKRTPPVQELHTIRMHWPAPCKSWTLIPNACPWWPHLPRHICLLFSH